MAPEYKQAALVCRSPGARDARELTLPFRQLADSFPFKGRSKRSPQR